MVTSAPSALCVRVRLSGADPSPSVRLSTQHRSNTAGALHPPVIHGSTVRASAAAASRRRCRLRLLCRAARIRCRALLLSPRASGRDCVEVLPTLSEEELEAACPPIARPRGFWRSCAGTVVPVRRAHAALVEAPRLARCVFHRPAGGSGRWPVEMEVSLDGVVTVQACSLPEDTERRWPHPGTEPPPLPAPPRRRAEAAERSEQRLRRPR